MYMQCNWYNFCYSEFMKEVCERYAGMTVFLDATHKVTRYHDVSLVILAARTNSKFQVITNYRPTRVKVVDVSYDPISNK